MSGFFGLPFAGRDDCNRCKTSFCGASACGCGDDRGCGEKRGWFGGMNWFNKGCEDRCGCDDKCGDRKFRNNFGDWFN